MVDLSPEYYNANPDLPKLCQELVNLLHEPRDLFVDALIALHLETCPTCRAYLASLDAAASQAVHPDVTAEQIEAEK